MEVRVIRVEHGSKLFKETIAMASLDSSIRKELGYPMSSIEGQIWWIAIVGIETIGFCSLIGKGNEIRFSHDYVVKEFRSNGVYDKLFNERMEYAKTFSKKITSVATHKSLGTFLRYGFEPIKKLTNYTNVIYTPK